MGILRNAGGDALYPNGTNNIISEDSSFVVGDSPRTITVNATLGRNGNRGYLVIDGAGDILVSLSHSDSAYTTAFTLKNGDSFDFTGLDLFQVLLTHSGVDSAYRLHIW